MLIEQLRSHQFVVGLLKFFRLIFLGIISVHHIDARQIFTGYTVDVIRQFLHTADTRHDHRNDDCHHGKQRHDKAGGDNRQRPAFVDDLYDRPNRHDRRFDHNLQAHCHKHLDLRDVIRRAVDQARNRKLLHFINVKYFEKLEQYIAAGEMALDEIETIKTRFQNDQTMNPQEVQIKVQQLDIAKDMLSQRIYDLQIAENVAMQTCPMIQTMQMSNFNLLRKINSSFIITLPIFKQCLVQAIQLKRQEIQAKSIQQLDEKTNELLIRNAQNTATQSVNIAKMAGGSSIKIETLQETYETIKNGIQETKQISADLAAKRNTDMQTLETMKTDMKQNGFVH